MSGMTLGSLALVFFVILFPGLAVPGPISVDIQGVNTRWGFLGLGGVFTGREKITADILNGITDEVGLRTRFSIDQWTRPVQAGQQGSWVPRESATSDPFDLAANQRATAVAKPPRFAPKKVTVDVIDAQGEVQGARRAFATRGLWLEEIDGSLEYGVPIKVNAKVKFKVRAVEAIANDPLLNLSVLDALPASGYFNSEGGYDPCLWVEDTPLQSECDANEPLSSLLESAHLLSLGFEFAPLEWFSFDVTSIVMDQSGDSFAELSVTPTRAGNFLVRVHGDTTDSGEIDPGDLLTSIDGNLRLDTLLIFSAVEVSAPVPFVLILLGLLSMAALSVLPQRVGKRRYSSILGPS